MQEIRGKASGQVAKWPSGKGQVVPNWCQPASFTKKTLGLRYEPANHGRLQQDVFLVKPRHTAMPVKE
jgi:hypothetical protein